MRTQSIKSQVYEGIMKDILDGVYQANDIINEKNLVEKYGVSKTPVREALVQLCSEGVLQNIPRFGYQLKAILPGQIVELIEFRKIIELGALEQCFNRITGEQLEQLKTMNSVAESISRTQNPRLHWESNHEFHRVLCSFSENQYLQQSLESVLQICTRISNQYFTKLWKESRVTDGTNHVYLVQAIEKQNLELAKSILKEDVESFRKEIL